MRQIVSGQGLRVRIAEDVSRVSRHPGDLISIDPMGVVSTLLTLG